MPNWIPCKYAELHDGLFIPGVGDFPKRIVKGAEGKVKDVQMYLGTDHLVLEVKGTQTWIPLANVKGVQPEEKVSVK